MSPPVRVMAGLHGSAALLLILAGAGKLARPRAAADLLGLLGLPGRGGLARSIGAVEVVAALAALVVGGPVASGAVAVLYGMFAWAVLRALAVGAPSCGCFGDYRAPPSRVHVAGNAVLCGVSSVAAGAAESPVGVVSAATAESPAAGAAFVLLVLAVAGLFLVAFTALPEALAAQSASGGPARPFRIEPGALPVSASSPEALGGRV